MTKDEQRKKDSANIQELINSAYETCHGNMPSSDARILALTLLSCTKIISNRLIDLDETLEEVAATIQRNANNGRI